LPLTSIKTAWVSRKDVLPSIFGAIFGVDYHILSKDTYSVSQEEKVPEGKNLSAGFGSRLRRGSLYTYAKRWCTKVALGHHREDIR